MNRAWLVRAVIIAGISLSGCGPSMFFRADGYDAQGCVEDSLRRSPDPTTFEMAWAEFELGCRAADAGACSALGVMAELGRGRPPSRRLAQSLYNRACRAGNQRGCMNASRLAEDSRRVSGEVANVDAAVPADRVVVTLRDADIPLRQPTKP